MRIAYAPHLPRTLTIQPTPPPSNRLSEVGYWSDAEASEYRVARVRRRLLRWGRVNFQNYEWRAETGPWLTLVAEWMLQRTRARQAEQAFRVFRTRFPTAESLVRAGPDAPREITALTGLHWRGAHLYGLATAVQANGGTPPESELELRRITGVGMYTAAAWLSLHRGKRAVIVDSNIARWLARLTGRPYPRDPRPVRWVKELADQLTPLRAFQAYNYAALDFTMLICTVRSPHCERCPLRPDCVYGTTHQPRTAR